MLKILTLKICIFGIASLLTSSAHGFTLVSSTSTSFRGWANPTIRFQLNAANCPAGADINGIIGDALAVWNDTATSRVKLEMAGTTTATTPTNPIPIICDPAYGPDQASKDGSPGAADPQPRTGDELNSGIMYLNASNGRANIGNLSRSLVAIVLAHEIGHLLGLGHSQDTNALMYYNAGSKSTLSLAQDDIDGVSYLYPRNEFGGDKPLGCALVKNSQMPSPPGPRGLMIFALLAPMVLALWLRGKFGSSTSFS